MDKVKTTSDYHVHCGQYFDNYYQPATIIKCLYNNGIKNAWISSTTSCIDWSNSEEKEYLINHVNDEIQEAVLTAKDLNMNLIPLYWVVPRRHMEGETIEDILINSYYKGFKIHTKVGEWQFDTIDIMRLFEEVCLCAQKYNIPILIHTGVDSTDSPKRFEKFFAKYNSVKFVLAHCKDSEAIISILKKYNNVYGDISFCPEASFSKICEYGLKSRILFATDFPVSHWIYKMSNKRLSEQILSDFYRKNIDEIERIFDKV